MIQNIQCVMMVIEGHCHIFGISEHKDKFASLLEKVLWKMLSVKMRIEHPW